MITMTEQQLKQFTLHAKFCLPEEACALLLGLAVKKCQKLRWLSDFTLSISMIVGMAAAVLFSM